MRVLMVTPSYHPIIGGTETYVQQLTHKLDEKGVIAEVMTFNMDSKWRPRKIDEIRREDGFKVYRVSAYNPRILNVRGHTPYGESLNVHVIPKLDFSRHFKEYDIIHFHDDADLSFPFFSYVLRAGNGPRLLHCHSLPYTYQKYKKNPLLGAFLKKMADLYVGLSKHTLDLLLDLGLPRNKVITLPNAVDTCVFKPSRAKTENLVLYAARINQSKGLDVLIKALFQLDIPTSLAIIGPVQDRRFFLEIQYLVKKVNEKTPHKVTYLGCVNKSTLIEWHQKASLFVCPSTSDHFPISILEAMACGTPVIATRLGAIPEVIQTGINGILVSPNDPVHLANALRELLEDKKKREIYGRNARKSAEKDFSWQVVLGRLLRTYRKLLLCTAEN